MFKSISKNALFITAVLLFTGCGGGGGSSDNNNNQNLNRTITGKAIDGYIKNATVCLDTDKDNNCSDEKEYNITDENGSYTLIVSGNINEGTPLIVQGGIDTDTGGEINATFKAPYDGSESINITPLTTLAYNIIESNKSIKIEEAYEKVAEVLGLDDPDKVKTDYIEKNNTVIVKKVLKIHQTAVLLAKETNKPVDKIYEHLSEGILEVSQQNTSYEDLNITNIVNKSGISNDINNTIIEKVEIIEKAIKEINESNKTIDELALIIDKVREKIENNNSISNDNDVNISALLNSIDPIEVKIENILENEFNITNSNITTNIETIISDLNITSASNISKEKLCELKDINNTIYQQLQLDKECEDSNNIENIQENLILPPTVPIINNNGEINSSQGELALPPTVPQI